jgi:6-phosphogluconolactonase
MDSLTFFIGSYTQKLSSEIVGFGDGISTVQLDEKTGELSVLHTMMTINPSYLVISADNNYLYCNTEVIEEMLPKVQAFRIRHDYSLQFLNSQPISGGCPCHIEILNKNILISCYMSGNMLEFPISKSGNILECSNDFQHIGSSINTLRQVAAHAHQVAIHPDRKDVYVCDLGIDIIKAYHLQGKGLKSNKSKDIEVEKGGGPRHLVFNKKGSLGYVINELTGIVSVLKNNRTKFEQIKSYNSLPETYKDAPGSSAIRIHPKGRFLYVGNRNFDAITIFRVNGENLELLEYKHTNGSELREFNITPNGKWLIACHQNSNDTIVYQINSDGLLKEVDRTREIKTPVCVAYLKPIAK